MRADHSRRETQVFAEVYCREVSELLSADDVLARLVERHAPLFDGADARAALDAQRHHVSWASAEVLSSDFPEFLNLHECF